ncbi:hypothetical protein TNCV_5011391 [Trichonephila clavipes]|nr:hypothetical protein TNCV_5011391 [Trichonephila clavipes]
MSDIIRHRYGEATQMEACHENPLIAVPTGRWMYKPPLGQRRNERKEKGECSATRGPRQPWTTHGRTPLKRKRKFCRVMIPGFTVKKRLPKRCTGHLATKTRRETHIERL